MNVKVKTAAIWACLAVVILFCLEIKFRVIRSDNTMAINSASFEVFGLVQGVFFRKNTKDQADKLGIKGWCLNTREGTVKGVIEGNPEAFNEMKNWLNSIGSPQSRIDKTIFSETKSLASSEFQSFEIRRLPRV